MHGISSPIVIKNIKTVSAAMPLALVLPAAMAPAGARCAAHARQR